jgi:hypothetical protein
MLTGVLLNSVLSQYFYKWSCFFTGTSIDCGIPSIVSSSPRFDVAGSVLQQGLSYTFTMAVLKYTTQLSSCSVTVTTFAKNQTCLNTPLKLAFNQQNAINYMDPNLDSYFGCSFVSQDFNILVSLPTYTFSLIDLKTGINLLKTSSPSREIVFNVLRLKAMSFSADTSYSLNCKLTSSNYCGNIT